MAPAKKSASFHGNTKSPHTRFARPRPKALGCRWLLFAMAICSLPTPSTAQIQGQYTAVVNASDSLGTPIRGTVTFGIDSTTIAAEGKGVWQAGGMYNIAYTTTCTAGANPPGTYTLSGPTQVGIPSGNDAGINVQMLVPGGQLLLGVAGSIDLLTTAPFEGVGTYSIGKSTYAHSYFPDPCGAGQLEPVTGTLTVIRNLQITTVALPTLVIGKPYSATLTAVGGSGAGYTWSAQGLSAGFSLTPGGVLSESGTSILTPQVYGWNFQVTDSAGNTATQSLFLTGAYPTPSAILVDPVPQLLSSGAVLSANASNGPNALATGGRVVQGIAADGTAELVIRVAGVVAGEQLTLSLANFTSANSDGALGLPGDTTFSASSVTVNAITTPQGPMAFAVYRAPIDFVRAGVTGDTILASRNETIQITPEAAPAIEQTIAILRPPVVLVHGIWSNAKDTWGAFQPLYSNGRSNDSRFAVTTVDYSYIVGNFTYFGKPLPLHANALGFQYNAPTVLSQLRMALGQFKNGANPLTIQVADVQADIVAHSMGGDIIRTLATPPSPPGAFSFYSDDNFRMGDVHKLITIDTPHLGTPVATQLLSPANQCVARILFAQQLPAISTQLVHGVNVSGAINDLSGGGYVGGLLSDALTALQARNGNSRLIPTAMIASDEEARNLSTLGACTTLALCQSLAVVSPYWCDKDFLTPYMAPQSWPAVFGSVVPSMGDDGLVPMRSQLNGVTSTSNQQLFSGLIHSPGTEKLGFTGPSVLDAPTQSVPSEVIVLLNTPVTNETVFNLFTP